MADTAPRRVVKGLRMFFLWFTVSQEERDEWFPARPYLGAVWLAFWGAVVMPMPLVILVWSMVLFGIVLAMAVCFLGYLLFDVRRMLRDDKSPSDPR